MKKIIFLTEDITKAGGVNRVVNLWANFFAKKKFMVEIIATNIKDIYYPLDSSILLTHWNFEYKHKILGLPYNIIQTYFLLKKYNNNNKINFVIDRAIHIEPIWLFRKLGFFKNFNLIYFVHGGSSDFRNFYMKRPYMRHKVKMIFEAFDKVICLYDDEKNYPKQVKREKLFFIPNPLPFEPSNIEFNQKENIVLSLGRITKEKGIDILIKAWNILGDKTKDWKLQIIGDGKDKQKFIELAKKLKIANIEFKDATTDVKPLYEKTKIFVIPSLFEGMPMTILEAMACKCAVISSKTAGGKKLIKDNETGLLFDINNEDQLKEKIGFLIENEKVLKKIAVNGFKSIQNYKLEKIEKKWEDVFV